MYVNIIRMAESQSLRDRVMGCAAQEGHTDPRGFADRNMMRIVASDSAWVASWDYAAAEYNVNQNPDIGARTDVISDGMILSQVQPLVLAEQPPAD